ncbi:MAG: hypothetical protein LBS09_05985 [Bacteroidales bacterium]|nr:hypothetical protein [Bacteroidales bacterium]
MPEIITFLKESFRLAVVQSFIHEKITEETEKQAGKPLTSEKKEETVKKCLAQEPEIIHYLKTMFYQSLYSREKGEKDAKFKFRQKDKIDSIDKRRIEMFQNLEKTMSLWTDTT